MDPQGLFIKKFVKQTFDILSLFDSNIVKREKDKV